MTKRPLFFLLILLCTRLSAQQKLTLKNAIDIAIKNNETLKLAEYEVEYSKAFKDGVLDFGKTNAVLTYGQFNSLYIDNNITVNQTFSNPYYYSLQSKWAKANISNNQQKMLNAKNVLIRDVRRNFNELVYYKNKHNLLRQQDSLFNEILNDVEKKFGSGTENFLEKASAESQSLEIKNMIDENDENILQAEASLQALLRLSTFVDVEEDVLKKLDFIVPTVDEVVGKNPDLIVYLNEAMLKNRSIGIEKSKLLPDVTLGYFSQTITGWQTINNVDRYFDRSSRFQGIQAGISFPFWAKPYSAKIREAKISSKIAEVQKDNFEANLKGTTNVYLAQYKKYSHSMDYYENKALPLADQIEKSADVNYKTGQNTYLECVDAFNQAMNIRLCYIAKLKAYNESIIELEYLMGINR